MAPASKRIKNNNSGALNLRLKVIKLNWSTRSLCATVNVFDASFGCSLGLMSSWAECHKTHS